MNKLVAKLFIIVQGILFVIITIITFWLFYIYKTNPSMYQLLIGILSIPLILTNKCLYVAKSIDIEVSPRYIYHLLSQKKLDTILATESKGKESGYVQIHLKPTRSFLKNYSTLGKPACYFHSSLKGYSYYFNHAQKFSPLDYLLIVDTKDMDKELLKERRIDNCIVYTSDYKGKAKLFKCDKFSFVKWNKIFEHTEIFLIDRICSLVTCGIVLSLLMVVLDYQWTRL